jgi:hypothetical protein
MVWPVCLFWIILDILGGYEGKNVEMLEWDDLDDSRSLLTEEKVLIIPQLYYSKSECFKSLYRFPFSGVVQKNIILVFAWGVNGYLNL